MGRSRTRCRLKLLAHGGATFTAVVQARMGADLARPPGGRSGPCNRKIEFPAGFVAVR